MSTTTNNESNDTSDSNTVPTQFLPIEGPGRCTMCGWHVESMGHHPQCSAPHVTEPAWEPYVDEDGTVQPWTPLPGCDDLDKHTTNGLLRDGVELYQAPDIPAVREHNQAVVQRWIAEDELRQKQRRERWHEVKAAANATENRRLAGYARNSIDGIISDVEAVADGPQWAKTLFWKAGKLAGWHELGFIEESATDCKATLLRAAAPWNSYEERCAEMHIRNGWDKPIAPDIPDYVFENPGIRAETGKALPINSSGGGDAAGGSAKRETGHDTADSDEGPTPVLADSLLTRSDLRSLPVPEPLIANVLDQGTTALLYGKWSTGKTFIALDWAACVATGKRWQNRETQQRRVLYVVAEGAFGFGPRTDAWEVAWKSKIGDEWLSVYPYPVNLTNPREVDQLRALIEWGGYGFVVLDTLARCMVGADENSAQDCGIVIDVMTKLRASTPGGRGTILAVHHAGKDAKTLRGSSALESGVDTVYSTSRDDEGWVSLRRTKRKDGPEYDHHVFKIDPIPSTDSAVMSVSARHGGDGEALPSARSAELLAIFTQNFETTGASSGTLKAVAEEAGMTKTTYYRALNDLMDRGKLVNEGTNQRTHYRLAQ